ncbi:polymorphic toxin-type HINT domain-containing protein [Kingella oralis]|uniref:polymorphic toxin-type HINT domain-containing protein n=1 Tax=Kingella oralis TaxID=505 RepID=UPI003F73A02C
MYGGKSQTLIANTIHLFFANGRQTAAGSLKAGDVLQSENGAAQTVQSVETKAEALTAYNLTVADFHTYFVKGAESGTDAVWVHNECPVYDPHSTAKDPANGQVTNVPDLNGKTPDEIKKILSENGFTPKSNEISEQGWQTFTHPDKSKIDINWHEGRIVRTAAPRYDPKTGQRVNKGQRVDYNGHQIPRNTPHDQHPIERAKL